MSDTDERPIQPPVPEGKKAQWVRPRKDGSGHGTWRIVDIHRKKTGPRQPTKKGPVPGKPRMTNPTHASHIYEQLEVPIAFLLGLKNAAMANMAQDYIMAAMINKALRAIDDARVFINRFTTNRPDLEE